MPEIRIHDASDDRLAEYRLIGEADLVRRRGLFVAEGRLVVRRLLEDRRYSVRSLLLNAAAYRDLEAALAPRIDELPVFICPSDDVLSVTGFDFHRGCLALVERPPDSPYDRLIPAARRIIALEHVANADNVGGVFRSAAAFGVGAVLLSPACCDPLYRKAVRTSMAATLRVPFARLDPWPDRLQTLRDDGYTLVALTPDPTAESLVTFARTSRAPREAYLFGSEGAGLSRAVLDLADARVHIPIRPGVDSLNLSVAAGIALSWLTSAADLD